MRCAALGVLMFLVLLLACDHGPPPDGRLHLEGRGIVRHPPDPTFPEEGRYVIAGGRTARGVPAAHR